MLIREMMAMYHSLQFVEELLDYIEQYPDDDYMTMECLCRKLHKYELIAKVDGHWQPLDKRCEDCIFVEGSHWCDGCDKTPKGMKEYDEYWAKADRKTEPKTDYKMPYEDCEDCETHLKAQMQARKTEPQTEEWHDDCNTCRWHDGACTIPCCDYEPKTEPQTDCSWK